MQSHATRCAIYLRISLDATGEGLAVERQRQDAVKLADDRGWTVVEEYVDNSISAFKRTKVRPAYERMLADYRSGRFDALIVWDLDRLTRQPRQLEDWIEYAEDRGLKLVTANGEADLTTDAGRLFARIKAAVARGESERKGARQTRAIQQRVEMGRPLAGVRLTGYDKDGAIDAREAEVVRDMFARFAAGESLKGIARLLDEHGITTRRGASWNPSTVSGMLRNARYAGRVMFKGQQTGDRGTWDPIVEADLFDMVQSRLNDPRRIHNREGTARKWLGSGLYICGVCDRPVRTNGTRYWCPQGDHVLRSMKPVDDYVLLFVEARLSTPGVVGAFARRDDARAAELQAQSDALRGRLVKIEADYDDELIDGRRYKTATAKVNAELEAVSRQRAQLVGSTALATLLLADDPVKAFRGATLDARRELIRALVTVKLYRAPVGSRTFNPDTVDVRPVSDANTSRKDAR